MGYQTAVIDALGNTTYHTWSGEDITSVTDALGRQTIPVGQRWMPREAATAWSRRATPRLAQQSMGRPRVVWTGDSVVQQAGGVALGGLQGRSCGESVKRDRAHGVTGRRFF
jgi:hypothetical protein